MYVKRYLALFLMVMLMVGSLFAIGCEADEVVDEPVDEPVEEPVDDPDEEPVDEPEPVDITVTVGSKEFTEQLVLGQIAILALEHNGIPVEDETGLGGTAIAREALEAGDIDLYWEYTGTGLITIHGFDEAITDPVEAFSVVSEIDRDEYGLIWLDYTPFDNTYAIMMREADAEELGINTISDLADAINEGVEAPDPGTWLFGSNHEYSTRDDGYPGLLEHYGFAFDDVNVMDYGILYSALRDGDIAVSMAFATDGRIPAFGLTILEDDLAFHPVYNAAPVVRQEVLDAAPQIADILNPIAAALDVDAMSNLNMLVDEMDYLPSEAAEEWLVEQGFIE